MKRRSFVASVRCGAQVKSAMFSTSGAWLATCSRDKSVWIYERGGDGFECDCYSMLHGHTQDVKKVRPRPLA